MNNKFQNSKEWAKMLANFLISMYENEKLDKYKLSDWISTIFLAWAPWAWKTEFLETVLVSESFMVIDIDKYRSYFEWYNWKNADLYQDSSSRVATKIFDYCIKKDLKVIFDGTLTSEMWVKNIKKSLDKNRKIWIILIYQDPIISYLYTILRQENNERKVSIEAFLRIYYNSIKYCFEVSQKYKNIEFIIWSKDKNRKRQQMVFTNKDRFDKKFNIEYNSDDLKEKLEKLKEKNILQLIQWLWKKD